LLADTAQWVQLGEVVAIEQHDAYLYLLEVRLHTRRVVLARPMYNAGYFKISVGDEALILFPGGNPDQAVCVGTLMSKKAGRQPTIAYNNADHVTDAGAGKMVAIGSEIQLGEQANKYVALADKVTTEIGKVRTAYSTHTHPVPMVGVTGLAVPTLAATASVASTNTKVEG